MNPHYLHLHTHTHSALFSALKLFFAPLPPCFLQSRKRAPLKICVESRKRAPLQVCVEATFAVKGKYEKIRRASNSIFYSSLCFVLLLLLLLLLLELESVGLDTEAEKMGVIRYSPLIR